MKILVAKGDLRIGADSVSVKIASIPYCRLAIACAEKPYPTKNMVKNMTSQTISRKCQYMAACLTGA